MKRKLLGDKETLVGLTPDRTCMYLDSVCTWSSVTSNTYYY
jgi:hypothetical protein